MTPKILCIHRTPKDQLDWTAKHFHREAIKLGFSSCRFHYLILKDGTLEQTRDISEPGHHCLKELKASNKNSVGVCVVGRELTVAQAHYLDHLIQSLTLLNPSLEIKYA